ncbi:MAG TPA: YpdA family putative bacillithiol disulfide reductase [Gemmatimonadales bacterium]|nr:YpdA family putative bacillithiol disulfide reductase [Gemmatimonadales bacterium]
MEDSLIAGAGPIGLACAVSAKRHGVDPLVIDAGPVVNSVVRYPIGMTFFTTPEKMEIGGHPFACAGQKATREEALKYYRGVARNEALRVRPYVRLTAAQRQNGAIECVLATRTGEERVTTRRLVLATGYFDHPNLLGVPGEDLPHVSHYFDEPHRGFNLDVVVIGGRNSAVEAALELFRAGARVTLVYRGKELPGSIKYWVRPDIENRIKAGEIAARLGAEVQRVTGDAVVIKQGRKEEAIPAQRVYALTGYHPDFDLFKGMGIALDPKTLRATLDPDTRQTNVPGIYMVGSISAGRAISEIFIENGRFDGDKIFA